MGPEDGEQHTIWYYNRCCHKLAYFKYLKFILKNGFYDSCHEWQLPLVTTVIYTKILFGGV